MLECTFFSRGLPWFESTETCLRPIFQFHGIFTDQKMAEDSNHIVNQNIKFEAGLLYPLKSSQVLEKKSSYNKKVTTHFQEI